MVENNSHTRARINAHTEKMNGKKKSNEKALFLTTAYLNILVSVFCDVLHLLWWTDANEIIPTTFIQMSYLSEPATSHFQLCEPAKGTPISALIGQHPFLKYTNKLCATDYIELFP